MNISAANVSGLGGKEEEYVWIWDDATWILGASFIVFTMQTGESVNFNNILRAAFLYESLFRSFQVLAVCVCGTSQL